MLGRSALYTMRCPQPFWFRAVQGFAPSASPSGRRTNSPPHVGEGFSSLNPNIAIFNTGALNYVEFRAAMHPTWCMAERVGFEPTSPFGRTAFRERRLKPLGNLSLLKRSY